MFTEILNELKGSSKLSSFYFSDSEDDRFIFGRLSCFNSDFVVIESYDQYGREDGYIIKSIATLSKIETNSKYSKKMEKLILSYDSEHLRIDLKNGNIIELFLQLSRDKHKIVSLELSDNNKLLVGIVLSVDNHICNLSQIDDYAYNDGEIMFSVDDINMITFDGMDEKVLEKLLEHNTNHQSGDGSMIDSDKH